MRKNVTKNQMEIIKVIKYSKLNKYLTGWDQEENGDRGE